MALVNFIKLVFISFYSRLQMLH